MLRKRLGCGLAKSAIVFSLLLMGCAPDTFPGGAGPGGGDSAISGALSTLPPSATPMPTATPTPQPPFPVAPRTGIRPPITSELLVGGDLLAGPAAWGDTLAADSPLQANLQFLQEALWETNGFAVEAQAIRVYLAPDGQTSTLLAGTADGAGVYWLVDDGSAGPAHFSADPYAPAFADEAQRRDLHYELVPLPDGITAADLRVGWAHGEDDSAWPVVCYWKKRLYRVFDPATGGFIEARPLQGDFIHEGELFFPKSGVRMRLWVEHGGYYDGRVSLGYGLERAYLEALQRNAGYESVEEMLAAAAAANGVVDVQYPRPNDDHTIHWTEPIPTYIYELDIYMADDADAKAHYPTAYRDMLRMSSGPLIGMTVIDQRAQILISRIVLPEYDVRYNANTIGYIFKALGLDKTNPEAWYRVYHPVAGYDWAPGGGQVVGMYVPPFVAADTTLNP